MVAQITLHVLLFICVFHNLRLNFHFSFSYIWLACTLDSNSQHAAGNRLICTKCFIFGKSWLWKPCNRCLRMDVATCIVSLRLSMKWSFHYSLHYQFHCSFHICNGGWREWNWDSRCIPIHPISLFSSGFSMKWRRTHEAPISLFP